MCIGELAGGKTEARSCFIDLKIAWYGKDYLLTLKKPHLVDCRVKSAVIHGKIQHPLLQLLFQPCRGCFMQTQFYAGIPFGKGAEQRRQH